MELELERVLAAAETLAGLLLATNQLKSRGQQARLDEAFGSLTELLAALESGPHEFLRCGGSRFSSQG